MTGFFLVFSFAIPFAQNDWTNYSNLDLINDFLFSESGVLIASEGGLGEYDQSNNKWNFHRPMNSDLLTTKVKEIEGSIDDTLWILQNQKILIRKNGTSWQFFNDLYELPNISRIRNLTLDKQGTLWFIVIDDICNCGKLASIKDDEFMIHNLSLSTVSDFRIDSENNIIVRNVSNLLKYDGELQLDYLHNLDLVVDYIKFEGSFFLDANDDIWIVSYGESQSGPIQLLHFSNQQWVMVHNDLPGALVFKGQNDGLYLFQFKHELEESSFGTFHKSDGWDFWTSQDVVLQPFENLHFLGRDLDKYDWYSYYNPLTRKQVLYWIKNGESQTASLQPDGLQYNYYRDILVDCEDNMWVSSFKGLATFANNVWEHIPNVENWEYRNFQLNPVDCKLWFSHENNLVSFDGAQFDIQYDLPTEIRDFSISPSGTFYIATLTEGVFYLDNGEWRKIEDLLSEEEDITSVEVDSEENIYVVNSHNGLIKYYNGVQENFTILNAPIDYYVQSVYIDSNDKLWVVDATGLLRFDGIDDWTKIYIPDAEPTYISIMDVEELAQDHFCFALANLGLFTYHEGALQKYDILNSDVGSLDLFNLQMHPNGELWVQQSHCISSFQPILDLRGGLSGTVFFDADQDGVNNDEPFLGNQKLKIAETNQIAISNSKGQFKFYPAQTGNLTLIPQTDTHWISTTMDSVLLYQGIEVEDLEIALFSENLHEGVELDLTLGNAVCGFKSNVWIQIRNLNFDQVSGTLRLEFDDKFEYISGFGTITSIGSNFVEWEVDALDFMQTASVPCIFKAPSFEFLGEEFDFTLSFIPDNGSEETETNVSQILLCSYDPNDKNGTSTGDTLNGLSLLEDALEYTIRFQNEGNYKATDVIIRDTLDENLDLNTFKVVSASHDYLVSINGRVVDFIFEDIVLPPKSENELASQGFIKFQIAIVSEEDIVIENTAHIYFDFNPAIVTNTTTNHLVNEFPLLSEKNLEKVNFLIIPNPTNDKIFIKTQNLERSLKFKLYDISGKMILQDQLSTNSINVKYLNSGLYYLSLYDKLGLIGTSKFIVQK